MLIRCLAYLGCRFLKSSQNECSYSLIGVLLSSLKLLHGHFNVAIKSVLRHNTIATFNYMSMDSSDSPTHNTFPPHWLFCLWLHQLLYYLHLQFMVQGIPDWEWGQVERLEGYSRKLRMIDGCVMAWDNTEVMPIVSLSIKFKMPDIEVHGENWLSLDSSQTLHHHDERPWIRWGPIEHLIPIVTEWCCLEMDCFSMAIQDLDLRWSHAQVPALLCF